VAKITSLTHRIAIQLHLVAESCIICSSRSRRPVQKLLGTPSYRRLGYGMDDRGSFLGGSNTGILSLRRCVQIGFGAHPASYPTDTVSLSSVIKRPGRQVDHSFLSSSEVKNAWGYTSTPQYIFMTWCLIKQCIHLHGLVLVKHRDNFTAVIAQSV
jgi:hypothetical protein